MCCLIVENLILIDESVAPLGLPLLFLLDRVQHSVASHFWFHVVLPSVAKNSNQRVMSKHDVCEDG